MCSEGGVIPADEDIVPVVEARVGEAGDESRGYEPKDMVLECHCRNGRMLERVQGE